MKHCNLLMFTAGLALVAGVASAATATADFTQEIGCLRKALHSSGWAPRSYPRSIQNDDANVAAMNLTYARTHDWALVNDGQRVVDYQYIFPLFHLDAKDPTNYLFEPTDHLLGLARNIGLDIFYRLGTSIEHTGNIHFNARVPKDFDKTAEIFAGIIRHYNKGWANGHQWNIKYWELWNEPDGITNMWWLPEAEGGKDREKMRDLFIKLFVKCLKRLKAEFPEVKVGGPALCSMKPWYFRPLLQACKDAGVAPDFISWHYYGSNPDAMVKSADDARKMCDEYGFTKCELILNEWHYLLVGRHPRQQLDARSGQKGASGTFRPQQHRLRLLYAHLAHQVPVLETRSGLLLRLRSRGQLGLPGRLPSAEQELACLPHLRRPCKELFRDVRRHRTGHRLRAGRQIRRWKESRSARRRLPRQGPDAHRGRQGDGRRQENVRNPARPHA